MKIRLLAFATAADAVGDRELELELAPGATVSAVLDRLEQEAPAFAKIRNRLAVAVNGKLVEPDTALADLDEVALLPPVSGGQAPGNRLVERAIGAEDVSRPDPRCGAEVVFLGRVRDHNDSTRPSAPGSALEVTGITYQAYEEMAERRLAAICAELSRDCVEVEILHRLGRLAVGEASIAIAARAPHRAEAFAACAEALERVKREAPIWKLEHYADGSFAWREEEPLSPEAGKPASFA